MSRIIDALNKLEKERRKAGPGRREHAKTFNIWILGLVVTAMFFTILGFNLRLFTLMKNYESEKNQVLGKLSKIEDLLNDYSQQLNNNYEITVKFNDTLVNLNNKVKDVFTMIQDLEKSKDSQSFAIENLTKAKDTLFNRLSSLEAKINK